MAGRTPAEAVANYVEPIQKTLSCVTRAVAQVNGGYHVADTPHGLTLNRGSPVPLKCEHRVSLIFRQQYRIVEAEGERGPWKVSIAEYVYEVEDASHTRVVAYHWHPESGKHFPHMHLGSGLGLASRPDVARAHLPTGRVSIEEVIRWVVEECAVETLRDDWESVLAGSQEAFEKWRTWSYSGPPSPNLGG